MRLLRHKALHITQIGGVYIIYISAGDINFPILHIPEAHKQLQESGFTAAAFAYKTDYSAFRDIQ